MPESRTALLVGATGLIGGHVLDLLLADPRYTAVTTLGRRPLDRDHPKLNHRILDFDALAEEADVVRGDDVFCCLGTTMKQVGSREAFKKVDLHYPHQLAEIAHANGAQHYLLVSALGADVASRIFYNRVKGDVEDLVEQVPFRAVSVFRPSLLTGDREETRRGEQVGEAVLGFVKPLLVGPLRPFRPISAETVARAMVAAARQAEQGIQVYEPEAIRSLAGVG